MNITFLIGNGFDLRLGLKTRFTDMYPEYLVQNSASPAIDQFKKMLRSDAPNYKTWGDFELAMAKKARNFKTEDAFVESLRDFKSYMSSHLEREEKSFSERLHEYPSTQELCSYEMYRSLKNFYKELSPNIVHEIDRLHRMDSLDYQCISFNYTSLFDKLLPPDFGDVLHIHGTLKEAAAVGVDNLTQVPGLPYEITERFERAFIKPTFNSNYDKERVKKAEHAIEYSDVICVYGLSLGLSDLSWIIRLKNWLLESIDHHLVYFVYDERTFNKLNWDAIMDEEHMRISSFLGRICDSTDEVNLLFNQVHIPVCYNIFDIDKIIANDHLEQAKKESIRNTLIISNKLRPRENGLGIV